MPVSLQEAERRSKLDHVPRKKCLISGREVLTYLSTHSLSFHSFRKYGRISPSSALKVLATEDIPGTGVWHLVSQMHGCDGAVRGAEGGAEDDLRLDFVCLCR